MKEYGAETVAEKAVERLIKILNGITYKIIKNALDISTEVDKEKIEKAINLFEDEN